jgi:hypothetical protein
MHPTAAGPELLHHYTIVIYPFRHDLLGRRRLARLATLAPRWAPWGARLPEGDLAAALEASAFFLPYIRGLLFPEVVRLQEETAGEPHGRWARLLHEWAAEGPEAFFGELPGGCVTRLTLRPALAGALAAFDLVPHRRHGAGGVAGRFDWVDAWLFPCGMGFLLLKARLGGQRPGLSELIRLNNALRLVHPPTALTALPTLRFAGGEGLTVPELFDYLLQGMTGPWGLPEEERALFPSPRPDRPARPYTGTEAGRSYGERCELLSYACVDLAAAGDLPAGPFPSAGDRVLFELAACVGLGESVHNPVWVPSAEQALRYCRDNRISLWRCWTGMVLKESFVFLATEDLPFTRQSLPRRVEDEYLPLYLYALYQKFQLFTFSTDLMREVALSADRLRGARALERRFIGFRSRYWFSEVTRKPQGGDLYRTLQQGLEVPALYAMVTGSVKEVKEHLEAVWARRLQWCKDLVTYGGPAGVVAGAVRVGLGATDCPLVLAGALTALTAALAAALLWCLRRGRRRRRSPPARPRRRAADLPALFRDRRPARGAAV